MTKNIKLKIQDFYSPDVEVHSCEPEAPEAVRFLLELEIGEAGNERKDLFQVVVATPEGLRAGAKDSVIADRATIVVSEYSWIQLRRAVEQIVERCEAPTWKEAVLRLQRYFRWEYEDYVQEA
jgi:ribosome biogenesis protein Tsr3